MAEDNGDNRYILKSEKSKKILFNSRYVFEGYELKLYPSNIK
jgi:hypothetical protein